jgi:hypothetical protein
MWRSLDPVHEFGEKFRILYINIVEHAAFIQYTPPAFTNQGASYSAPKRHVNKCGNQYFWGKFVHFF